MVAHIWENRRLAQILFNEETHMIVLQSFAACFEASLERALKLAGRKPILAPPLIALQLAAGQLAILRAWVSGRSGHSAHEMTVALHARAGH